MIVIDVVEAVEDGIEAHYRLESGQPGTEAEVLAVAERNVIVLNQLGSTLREQGDGVVELLVVQ